MLLVELCFGLLFLGALPGARAQNTTTTPAPTTEDDKTQSLAWWVIVVGVIIAFPLLIGSCYAMLMWQQKAMHDYKAKFEELLKALGENRRRTEAQLRKADKKKRRLAKKRRKELQAQGIDVDLEEEDQATNVYGVQINEDGIVISLGGDDEDAEALENLTPHQIACMNLLKSEDPVFQGIRRGPMMPPAANTYLPPQQGSKRRLVDDSEDESSEVDIDDYEASRPYDSFSRARREVYQRAKSQGVRLPLRESHDHDLFLAAQAAGIMDEPPQAFEARFAAIGGNKPTVGVASPAPLGGRVVHSDPQVDPLSALALRSSALHTTLAELRRTAPVKHSVDL